jgi:hypothetical protein
MVKLKAFLLFLLHAIMCPIGALILRGKRRCGFLDLGKDVEVVGELTAVDPGGGDGDVCFNVKTDPGYEWLRFYKGRDTSQGAPGELHCEFMPCSQFGALKKKLDEVISRFNAGEKLRLRIKGRWSYDGVHTAAFGQDGLTFKEVWACLMGHAANETSGWCEIHPATDLEIL